MNETIGAGRRRRLAMPPKPAHAAVGVGESRAHSGAAEPTGVLPAALPTDALDDRIAIVGTAGSGKTYAAKGFVERLLDIGARVAIVDPLGVWWGLRASADGTAAGYPVVVFGGKHADVPITAETGPALGRMIASEALACVIDLSELGSNAARRRFMAAFSEALYEANEEPLHLVLDEADLWAPQRPIKGWEGLLGHIEEVVRRGRVRGFIPWLITQRPAVVHKDVLSQADILITMKLTASQDRDAIGAWIEGQADRQEGKRILGDLPRLRRGEGYLWAPGHGILDRVSFPAISTFDSSRTPKRGERLATPRTLAAVDLTVIVAALAAAETENPESRRACPGLDPGRIGDGTRSSSRNWHWRKNRSRSSRRKTAS
jgi:DNA helicase HerA-like ATPase